MKITDLLKPQSILLNADPVTKADAIYTLGELMDKGGYLTDKAEYLKAVFAREESGSTGLGENDRGNLLTVSLAFYGVDDAFQARK